MAEIQRVLVVGGTHGNEKTGIQCVRALNRNIDQFSARSYTLETLLANTSAIEKNCRYIEQDLNRCFSNALLNGLPQNIEQSRAQEINKHYGPKGDNSATDWIIDLHTTTTNMGLTLVVHQNDKAAIQMAAYIQQRVPEAVIFYEDRDPAADNFLGSIAKHSLLIEVGPVPQGLLRWDIFQLTQTGLFHALDFIELYNTGEVPALPEVLLTYEFIEKLHLPRDKAGEICGMIHPAVQDKDYQQLNPGDPLFITDEGETICYDGDEQVYTAFVNEAAYYDQAHGLSLMRKKTLCI
ncbi:MAG: aspartoacylase [Neptuniibacter caesariensis]|uniref:Aspartoacylase n=1 Tax=Neptuniibacter caesariensis TaxID=207954 RepID=A0A2G6JC36_NEPCE|nr:MAG: aspartoacylase [Neptuniibacter caesariensis]